jgi:hypothetical protein
VVDDEDRVPLTRRQLHGAANLLAADDRGRHEQPCNAVRGKGLCLAQFRGATAHGTCLGEQLADGRALVRLAVRPEGAPAVLDGGRHLRDVRFEGVEVEQQCRCRDVVDHRRRDVWSGACEGCCLGGSRRRKRER